jgi:hypothetical protein
MCQVLKTLDICSKTLREDNIFLFIKCDFFQKKLSNFAKKNRC